MAETAGQTSIPKLSFGVAEDQGKREYMEDRNLIIPDYRPLGAPDDSCAATSLVGVFDGHLSSKAAELAANNLHAILAKEPGFLRALKRSQPVDLEEISMALRRSFQRCDREILATSKAEDNWKGGTTACVALSIDQDLLVGHVGDSGAFVIREGKARRLTRDHKPTDPKEAKRIEEAGGKVHTALNRVYSTDKGTLLAMSRALGDANFKEGAGAPTVSNRPDVRHLGLQPSDSALVLASDGVFDVLADQFAADIVLRTLQTQAPLEAKANQAAAALIDAALEAGSTDNCTALVVLLDWTS